MNGRIAAAAAVHVFTALGIVCALMAIRAVWSGTYEAAFAWLGLAFIIDGIDGTFARAAKVTTYLPRFSGERLDMVIDYITYVLIPVLALLQAGFLAGTLGLLLGAAILMSSLYHFADHGNKSDDNCFVGFPAIWNIVAFYFFAFGAKPWLVALIVIVCVALTFVPMRWVHPMRVKRLWLPTALACVAWSVAAAWTVWRGFPAEVWAKVVLLLVLAYGVGLSLWWPWSNPNDQVHEG
ncbi:MAG TPA: phosphatidylcholine synthase [Hyphomicrobiaceae bacterium]|nr:phosphatidylcholine synthase [Hyphomicrobiaceae bacterium]